MDALRTATPVAGDAAADDDQGVVLHDDPAFAAVSDPELERWIAIVRRQANVACAGLSLSDGSRQIIRVAGPGTDSSVRASEITADISLQDYLLGPKKAGGGDAGGAFAEARIVLAGKMMGRLALADPKPRTWTVEELAVLGDTAAGVATELERRLAKAQVARVHDLVASHNRVHDMIGTGAPLHDVLVEVCRIIERYDSSLMPSVLLRDPLSNTLHSGVGPSLPKEYLDSVDGAPIGPSVGTCGPAAWFGEFAISADLSQDPKWAPIRAMAELAGVAHCWSMPIKDTTGEVLGTLALYGRRPRRPQPEHVALLRDWARVVGTALERTRSLDRLKHDARHDSLTGLPNRAAIFEKLDTAIQQVRADAPLAVFFVDLDGLKAMNDTLGHDVADEMIREVARRLSHSVKATDFVGRFGGDEFIVVAESLGDPDAAGQLGARLLDAVAQPLPGLGSRVVTASIGIALIRTSAIDAREAIRRSDSAMYEAKRTGRDRCVFAEVGATVRAGRRLELVRALRGAETRGEMHLVYQPVISLPTRRVIGVEALLRWSSPTLGEVLPSEFIPIAEDSGSILQIGAWVLWESCQALADLTSAGHRLLISLGREARLTERAESLIEPLARAMEDLDFLLKPAEKFDPATESAHLVINTADYVIQLLAPILNDICAREAPRVALEFIATGTRNAADLTEIDFMIGPRAFGETYGKRVGHLPLWRDDIVCIAAASNSALPDRLTPAQFRTMRYAAFRIDQGIPPEVRTLLQPTSPIEIAPICTVPNFLVLGAIVQQSDCIALVPRKVARTLAREGNLRVVEISFPRKQIFIDAFWSRAMDGRRGRVWFREILARASAQLA